MTANGPAGPAARRPPSRVAGLLYGIGLGGFVDGIVLHQVLQWHHMASSTPDHPPTSLTGLKFNVLADGLFHAVTWVVVVAASVATLIAWRQGRLAPTWSFHFGLVLVGWGAFNLVEGVVDHQLLGIHHVRDDLGGPLAWDLGFLVIGAALVAVGWPWHRSGARALAAVPRP